MVAAIRLGQLRAYLAAQQQQRKQQQDLLRCGHGRSNTFGSPWQRCGCQAVVVLRPSRGLHKGGCAVQDGGQGRTVVTAATSLGLAGPVL